MWAPADLFGPGLSAFTLIGKRVFSYFFEEPLALGLAVLLAAVLIAAATLLRGRHRGGAR